MSKTLMQTKADLEVRLRTAENHLTMLDYIEDYLGGRYGLEKEIATCRQLLYAKTGDAKLVHDELMKGASNG